MSNNKFPTKFASSVALGLVVLTLSACKSDKLPTFPTNSPSSSLPIPSTGGIPSSLPTPPSLPSPSSSPTGSPSGSPSGSPGGQSGGGNPTSGPSGPSLPSPGLPDLGGKSGGGSSGDVAKSGQKGSSGKSGKDGKKGSGANEPGTPGGDQTGSARENRTAAGEGLQKAGEKIAKAGNEELDPLVPETDADGIPGDIFADGTSTSATSDNPANGTSGTGSGIPSELEDEIRAAQEALQTAGEALERAGEAVASAETDEELQAAEDLLGDARIAVIVATQDLETIEGDLGNSDVFDDTTAALQDANVVLVVATRSVLIARTGSAEFPEGEANGAPTNGEVAALEDELDESLVIFDGQIGSAREAVLARSTEPGSGGGNGLPDGTLSEAKLPIPTSEQGELMQLPDEASDEELDEQQIASAEMPNLNQGDIPDPQGDDIVATQLREAAMAETDPQLQAKLWEEYKRYKEGL